MNELLDPQRMLAVFSQRIEVFTEGDVWNELTSLGGEIHGRDHGSFYALPSERRLGYPFLHVRLHSHPENQDRIHWILAVDPMPDDSPPESITRQSREVGGFPGVLRKLDDLLPDAVKDSTETSVPGSSTCSQIVGGCRDSATSTPAWSGAMDLTHLDRVEHRGS
jgi:hypothetical protein